MATDDILVSIAWSMTDDLQQLPYHIVQKNKKNKLACSCPAFIYRGSTCKHIIGMRQAIINKTIENNKFFQLTEEGKRLLLKD